MSGSGTFENYNSVGVGCAATPDGRLNGQPVASDCSAQPYLQVCNWGLCKHLMRPCINDYVMLLAIVGLCW